MQKLIREKTGSKFNEWLYPVSASAPPTSLRFVCSYYSNTRTRGAYTHGGRERRAGIDMADCSFDAHFLGLAEFLPYDSEKKVHVLAPGQMEHFEALIDANEDEAAARRTLMSGLQCCG